MLSERIASLLATAISAETPWISITLLQILNFRNRLEHIQTDRMVLALDCNDLK